MATQERPLSPHLQIYRPQMTSLMSILHRATGVVLAMGALLFALWLYIVAGKSECFTQAQWFYSSVCVLLIFSVSLVYHMLNGIRHLLWDIGWGFEIKKTYLSGYTVLGLSVLITGLIWYVALKGGAV